jgi:hypothetical protein
MITCPYCTPAVYCCSECLQWDWRNGGHANTCDGNDNENNSDHARKSDAHTSSLMSDGNDDDSVNSIPMADIIGGDQM